MTKHINAGEHITAQQERIIRLQAELRQYRTNLSNGYGDAPTANDIANKIINAHPALIGAVATALVAHLVAERTQARRMPTVKDMASSVDIIVEE